MSGTAPAEDPRLIRSRQALLDAIAALLEQRDVAEISVTELAAAAGMSRPTFYQHFTDVPAAVAAAAARRIEDAFRHADARYAELPREAFVRGTLEEIVTEMASQRSFYRRVLSGPSSRVASDLVIGAVVDRMRVRILGGVGDEAAEDRLAVVGAGVTWLIVQWVQSEDAALDAPRSTVDRLTGLLLGLLPTAARR